MEAVRVNEEDSDANFVIELFNEGWKYVTTEYSISASTEVMNNLYIATNLKCRVLSRRSNYQVLAETD